MSEGPTNRYLHLARERLKKIPDRALEQGWETDDPLLCEIGIVVANALIAQAETSQETLRAMKELNQRIASIKAEVQYRPSIPYGDIDRYAKDTVYRYTKMAVEEEVKRQSGFWETLIRKLFGGKDAGE